MFSEIDISTKNLSTNYYCSIYYITSTVVEANSDFIESFCQYTPNFSYKIRNIVISKILKTHLRHHKNAKMFSSGIVTNVITEQFCSWNKV